jgi:hypothetical protein
MKSIKLHHLDGSWNGCNSEVREDEVQQEKASVSADNADDDNNNNNRRNNSNILIHISDYTRGFG